MPADARSRASRRQSVRHSLDQEGAHFGGSITYWPNRLYFVRLAPRFRFVEALKHDHYRSFWRIAAPNDGGCLASANEKFTPECSQRAGEFLDVFFIALLIGYGYFGDQVSRRPSLGIKYCIVTAVMPAPASTANPRLSCVFTISLPR
jgi:hypothetical protein